MKKILFLPLLRMQSGHHQVADALMDMLKQRTQGLVIKKVDLLSYTNQSLEKVITGSYLKWIRFAPETYNLAYKSFFYDPAANDTFKWYQHIFLKKMEQLLSVENPDLIVCTHGFPSSLISQLKRKGKCHVPVVNVYTDFFINNIWGVEGIDLHLLPSQEVKENLVRKKGISESRMIVTGIPVHEEISKNSALPKSPGKPKILVSGGNSGLGGIQKLSQGLIKSSHFDFLVLCGKNQKLYDQILSWDASHIKPLPYLSSRSEMNSLYDEVDAIITKPGGVTISEALHKRLPIFVHSMLPGQEEINLKYLRNKGLIFELDYKETIDQQLIGILMNQQRLHNWNRSLNTYVNEMEVQNPQKLTELINWMINHNQKVSRQA
ncbi:MGDG synthase family glycosyltransferase [Peribacillus kribbensis]|uniref:MGDG synthase family glycosyltransferase n=1 Tax=Peribacillus kribbensis TaxID=356658 RepID=UPI00041A64DD|nr:galactosyldiacylglycerol synthase [Peribacillus kribbensis]